MLNDIIFPTYAFHLKLLTFQSMILSLVWMAVALGGGRGSALGMGSSAVEAPAEGCLVCLDA